jgi:hypothetical protein
MLIPFRRTDGERGQVLVLFAAALVVIILFAGLAVDLGMLRNDRQTLVNTMDAAALAAGTQMPVDGNASPKGSAAGSEWALNQALIQATVAANYPGLVLGVDYSIEYRCLIGVDGNNQPWISRDIPAVCRPHGALGHMATVADFVGAGSTRNSPCDPTKQFNGVYDKCNVVVLRGIATTPFVLGPVAGIMSGTTGIVQSAACNGPCGEPPSVPIDVVLVIDRTGSMAGDEGNLEAAARAVLQAYDPTLQHVALATLGPSIPSSTCAGAGAHALPISLTPPPAPAYGSVSSAANASAGAGTLSINRPASTASGHFLVAGITVDGGSGTTITPPAGWTLIRRTDNSTNVAVASYYRVAGAEAGPYTWTFSPSRRASGGIIRFTGVNTSSPVNVSNGNIGGPGTALTANQVTTTVANTTLVGFFGTDTGATFTASGGTPLTERFDFRNADVAGPSGWGATATQANAAATGNKTATASLSAPWVGQLVALRPVPPPATYGTNTVTDLSKWVPVGLTGIGGQINQAYLNVDGTLNTSTHIVNAASCAPWNLSSTGTNLATPMAMAQAYLQTYGRPGIKKGIIFETDGTPNYNGSSGDPGNYTCSQALTNANAAKAAGIEIFTIGFSVEGQVCPDGGAAVESILGQMATGPIQGGSTCTAAENTDGDNFFCEPAGGDLTAIFQTAAIELADIRTHLVQLYPTPIVTGLSASSGPKAGGNVITISGQYFTGATSVSFGGVSAAFTVTGDTSIQVTVPAGSPNQKVSITVRTGGGVSIPFPSTAIDDYQYGP